MFSTWYFLKISCAFTCYCETACVSSLMNYASSIKRAQKYMTIIISSSAIALSNSVHIQDHLNPIYHQLQSILTVRTISQPYLTIKTKKAVGASGTVTWARRHVELCICVWFFCHGPVCHPVCQRGYCYSCIPQPWPQPRPLLLPCLLTQC